MKHSDLNQKKRFRVYLAVLASLLAVTTLLCACSESKNPAVAEESTTVPSDETSKEPSESETNEMMPQETIKEPETTLETETVSDASEETTATEPTELSFSWSNPMRYDDSENVEHLRDPFILKVGDAWYMTGTLPPYGMEDEQAKRTKGVPLYKSDDLLTWDFVDYIIETPLEAENKWYSERFWAAELFCHNGKYYVTVNCCRLDGSNHGFLFAVADEIEGPYTIMNPDEPFILGNDAHLFADDDGQVYLFGSGISMAKLDLENLQLLSTPKTILEPIPDSDAWNAQRPNVGFEGPFVLKHEGKYYCFYSTWARGYEIGVAVAEDINGPWVMYEDPIYGAMSQERCDYYGGVYEEGYYLHQDKYRECGHNSVFEGPDGGLWIAAHVTGGGVVNGVELVIDKLTFDEEHGLMAVDPATGKTVFGPTFGQQTVTYDPAAKEAKGVKALNVWGYTSVGEAYALPTQVDILMDNGFRRTTDVTWESAVNTEAEGSVTVKGTASLNGQTYPVEAYVQVSASLYEINCDFEDLDVGATDLTGTFGDVWSVLFSLCTEIGRPYATVTEEDGNRFVRNTAYWVVGLKDGAIEGDYEFSVNWRLLSGETVGGPSERLGGIALRSADKKLNHHDEDQNRVVGGSGIMIIPDENGIRVAVKKYVPDGNNYQVTSESVYFELPLGNTFQHFSVIDTGDRIEIYVKDALLCSLELGNVGTYQGSSYEYAKSVKLMDAGGTTLLEVEDALVTVDQAIHLIARGWTSFDVDDLCIRQLA